MGLTLLGDLREEQRRTEVTSSISLQKQAFRKGCHCAGSGLDWDIMWVQRSQGTSVVLVGTASQAQSGCGCRVPGFPDPANRGPEGR